MMEINGTEPQKQMTFCHPVERGCERHPMSTRFFALRLCQTLRAKKDKTNTHTRARLSECENNLVPGSTYAYEILLIRSYLLWLEVRNRIE